MHGRRSPRGRSSTSKRKAPERGLGDTIEALALGSVLGEGRAAGGRCAIGSVKTNIGHMETASGVASLMKAALALKHRQLPPNLHFHDAQPGHPFRPAAASRLAETRTLARRTARTAAGRGQRLRLRREQCPRRAGRAAGTGRGLSASRQIGNLPEIQRISLPLSARTGESLARSGPCATSSSSAMIRRLGATYATPLPSAGTITIAAWQSWRRRLRRRGNCSKVTSTATRGPACFREKTLRPRPQNRLCLPRGTMYPWSAGSGGCAAHAWPNPCPVRRNHGEYRRHGRADLELAIVGVFQGGWRRAPCTHGRRPAP